MNSKSDTINAEIDHTIDVRNEPDVLEAFNKFILKWCGENYPHLIDCDDNDGEFMRQKLEAYASQAVQASLEGECADD